MENRDTTGARLRQARKDAGIGTNEAARKLGTSTACLCGWERGTARPGFRYLAKIREIYGADLNWLVCGEKQSDLPDKHSPAISIPNQISA